MGARLLETGMDAKLSPLYLRGVMTDQPRAVVHLDLDAFFAAVEILENPDLADRPVVIGGRPGERGVVAAASYPARAFGIRSAMPMYQALKLCPHVVVRSPRHRLYLDYSRQVMAILRQASSQVEQMSIDEACLELTEQIESWHQAIEMARQLQRRVMEDVGLSASLGVATNKLVAKIASDRDKPGGLTIVPPGEEAAFLSGLPVRVLWGVGPVTAERLAETGVTTVGELVRVPEAELKERFGRHGTWMARQARGIDPRPVVTRRELKSASQERTFAHDLADEAAIKQQLWRLSQGVALRLTKAGLAAGTVALKLRYADFTTLTRQMALTAPTDGAQDIYRAALALLDQAWQRERPLRMLGVTGRNLSPPAGQMSFW